MEPLPVVSDSPVAPPIDPAGGAHTSLLEGSFWQQIPGYASIAESTFLDHHWQAKNTITRVEKLQELLGDLVPGSFYEDVRAGLAQAPMSLRISPYILSLIDWKSAESDPLRIQFLPMASQRKPNHPWIGLDSLAEQEHSPVPGLTHRYPDKALFLALDTCPVYCRFCTRSYAIGLDTPDVEKINFRVNLDRWQQAFAYIQAHPQIEDVIVSGGDTFQLRAAQLSEIGQRLLGIAHIRRIRFATKGLSVLPQKILTDEEWLDALTTTTQQARKQGVQVMVHTHINHPREITWITQRAAQRLFERAIPVRNQAVLLRRVNDTPQTMQLLTKRLGHLQIQPYYVFLHDLVRGVEDLRTTLHTAQTVEKLLRGTTAGFNTPTFVIDTPGGGGKRDVHSADYYDRTTGVSVFSSPLLHPGKPFLYVDPVDLLPPEGQARWAEERQHEQIRQEALENWRRVTAG